MVTGDLILGGREEEWGKKTRDVSEWAVSSLCSIWMHSTVIRCMRPHIFSEHPNRNFFWNSLW